MSAMDIIEQQADELDKLRREVAALRGAEWIECAKRKPPRDPDPAYAKTVLLFFGGEGGDEYNIGYYDPEDRVWVAYDGGGHYEEAVPPPTHWMALPNPPHTVGGSKT